MFRGQLMVDRAKLPARTLPGLFLIEIVITREARDLFSPAASSISLEAMRLALDTRADPSRQQMALVMTNESGGASQP